MIFNIDFHVHTDKSFDSRMKVSELVNQAKLKGLDGVAVCNHNAVFEDEIDYSDFLIIPGIEISTEYGHLVGLFVTEQIEHTSFTDDIDAIHKQGGLAVLPHPFMRSSKIKIPPELIKKLDAVEVWNSRAERKIFDANRRARKLADEYRLKYIACSDAHLEEEVGNGYLSIEADQFSPDSIKEAIIYNKNSYSGTRSRAMSIAKSSRIKIVRKQLGLKSKIKWGFFAIQCFFEDISIKQDKLKKID